MKIIRFATICCILRLTTSCYGQIAFENLNFESATLNASTGGNMVPASSALPGWTVFVGTTQQIDVMQNAANLNAPIVDILGPNDPASLAIPQGAPGIIDGNFTVAIQGGISGVGIESASIQQTGTIPAGDESLQFKAWAGPTTPSSEWSVSFGGNTLTLYALATTSQYTLYGADISAYVGQTGWLDFTAAGQGAPSFLELDDITFSTSSVPEPNPAILISLGGLIFAFCRRKMLRPPV
jgi:hypothetical protein